MHNVKGSVKADQKIIFIIIVCLLKAADCGSKHKGPLKGISINTAITFLF